ncbi:protein of unassigned function [Methylobacterium oryzae CBMB20]|uniref:Protein of unassigned function n=1 Tax=Methylobacterium oryzae CBMB20 TaxID=693986 RepID=A0A089NYS0_9HYPH|nr:protein of unassigned function [Methylobacterium oryzae CBMB20]
MRSRTPGSPSRPREPSPQASGGGAFPILPPVQDADDQESRAVRDRVDPVRL